ncbi:DUF863 family protein [Quillaja saponaria]|uniref:DUF863 family protein n=1 Tax=Quillaja saponaria TaxID=32244 RepID=A0AAD7LED4_QUISA|nr:DUF863 family protein [Quillaja saponaria]
MALLGMGANVQYNGYLLGYYSSKDLILGAEGSKCTLSNGDSELQSSLYHTSSLSALSPEQLSGYKKELVKQTMLQHEAIFRDQIHELHRLYQRQRELMDETKRSQSYKHELETSRPSSVVSHISVEHAPKLCCSPILPWLNTHCCQSSVSYTNKVQLQLGSVAVNSRQVQPVPSPTEGCPKGSELLEHKCKKVGSKVLDLQLPAEVYIDSEEGEALEDERLSKVPKVSAFLFNGISQIVDNSDEKPSPVNNRVDSVAHEDASIPISLSKIFKGVADLNQPAKLEEELASKSDEVLDLAGHRKISCDDLPTRSKSAFHISPKDIIQNPIIQKDIGACPYNPLSGKHEREHLWVSSSNETENSPSSSIHEELQQFHEVQSVHSLNHNNQKIWNGRNYSGVGSSERTQVPHSYGLLGTSSASPSCAPYQLVPQVDMVSSKLSPVACKQPVHYLGQIPIAVQALPCFSTSATSSKISRSLMERPGLDGGKFHQSFVLRSGTKLDSQSFLQSSSCSRSKILEVQLPSISFDNVKSNDKHCLAFNHDLGKCVQGSENMQTSKNLNLNLVPASFSDVTVFHSSQITDVERKFEDMTRGLPWLKEKPVDIGKPNEGSKIPTEVESVLLQAHYSGCSHEIELKMVEESDFSSKQKIIGFPIDGKPNTSCGQHLSCGSPSKTVPNQFGSEDIAKIMHNFTSDVNLSSTPVADSGECAPAGEHIVKTGLANKCEEFGGLFDLNSCMIEDEHRSADNELQAPVSPENKESSPPRGEPDENQHETLFQLSEDAELPEEEVRIAAEALVSILVSTAGNHLKMTTCRSFESSSDSLYWFAGIACATVDDPKNNINAGLSNESDVLRKFLPDDIDYFEAMTLQLTETEVQECCCKSNGKREEETGSTSSSMPPRKGRTRRGRQQKDFQSEILPSLASLSRYEVTEDLQTIGGLMEAAGTRLESCFMRSTGRNGFARGRRRASISASNITGKPVDLLFQQPASNSELDTERRGLTVGWGNKSGRQGHRYPTSNPRVIIW